MYIALLKKDIYMIYWAKAPAFMEADGIAKEQVL
ncbi:unnamed protein product, partial [marine sediment metagenome]